MRFERLDLIAWGPFADLELTFGRGFNVVFGPNEAGKSTALRAIAAFLYGVPHSTADAHRHDMPKLRIGAVLADGDGGRTELVRRKGRKATLRDATGEAVDESVLLALLGDVGKEMFEAVFALDHDRLRRGGQSILTGGGDLSESLFGAGLGREVTGVIAGLRASTEELFRPRATSKPLNVALREYSDANRQARQLALKPDEYRQLSRRLEEERAREAEIAGELKRLGRERERLERHRRLLPLLARHDLLVEEIRALGDVPDLGEDAARRREAAQKVIREAGPRAQTLAAEIERIEKSLEVIVVPGKLLDMEEEIERIRDDVGAYRKAAKDRERLEGEVLALRGREADARRRLGLADGTPLPEDTSALEAALDEARSGEGHAERVRRLDAEREAERAAAERELAAVGLWSGSVEEAARLPLPAEPAVARHERRFTEIERRRDRLGNREDELREELRRSEEELRALTKAGEVPTEADLLKAREERDALWAAVKAAWTAGEAADLDAYERSVEAADAIADRLRREADQAARHASLVAAIEERGRRLEELGGERRAIEEEESTAREDWGALWTFLDAEPRPPTEMRPWLAAHEKLRERVGRMEAATAERAGLTARIEEIRARLAGVLSELGMPDDGEPSVLVRRGEEYASALADVRTHARESESLERRIAAIDRDAEEMTHRVVSLARDMTPDLVGRPPDEIASELGRRFQKGQVDRQKHQDLGARRAEKREEVAEIEERRKIAAATLAELVRAAGGDSEEDLPEAERRSEEARELRRRRDDARERIAEAAPGATLDEVRAETSGVDLDELPGRIREIGEKIASREADRAARNQEIGGLKKELDKLDGTSAAAEAAARAQEALSRIRGLAERYARRRLALHLLEREVERYRKEHEGPLLSRSAEIFTRLTLGSFSTLRADYDEDGSPRLLCVRPGGEELHPEALSEGTADQLWLALQLAALEHHLAGGEPVPVVLDDVFVNFDDDRARAGLAVLGELAERTQVLFFTHHARLRDLAGSALGDGARIHTLGGRPAGPASRERD